LLISAEIQNLTTVPSEDGLNFGFSAEYGECNSFGIHLVSAESSRATSGKLSVLVAVIWTFDGC